MSVEEGQLHIKKAESLRSTGQLPNLELALTHYEKGLESMLLLHRNEVDTSKQAEIRAVIEIYMREAEELKDLISGMKSMMGNTLPPVPPSSHLPVYPQQQHHPLQPPADAHDFTAEARQRRQQQQASVTRLSSPGKAALASSTSAPSSSASSGASSLLNRATTFFSSRGNAATAKNPQHTTSASPVRSSSSGGGSSSSGGKSATASHGVAATAAAASQGPGPGSGPAGARVAAAAKLNDYEKQLLSELLDATPGVKWDDIAGLAFAKQTLQEAVILPNLRPDLFTGMTTPVFLSTLI